MKVWFFVCGLVGGLPMFILFALVATFTTGVGGWELPVIMLLGKWGFDSADWLDAKTVSAIKRKRGIV